MKNNMTEFKKILNQVVETLWDFGDEMVERSVSDWEDEYNDTLNELYGDSDYYSIENEITDSLMKDSAERLQKGYDALQKSLETDNDDKVYEVLLSLDAVLYNTTEIIRNTLPKIKAELAIEKYGFDETYKDKLEQLFAELQSKKCLCHDEY